MQSGESGGGLVCVDKPAGMTSHDVVAAVRRLAGTRRVGHAGTLDPAATGVLVLGVGRATRLLGHLSLTEKAYDATIRLGASTTTDDAEGEVIGGSAASQVSDERIEAGLAALTGELDQVPSAVSAIKVGGRRSYERVRRGEEVTLAARPVTVSVLRSRALERRGDAVDIEVEVVCSSGTYVRALARDLGAGLEVGGHLRTLRRTRVGPYDLTYARTLDALGEEFATIPLERVAADAFPVVRVGVDIARRVRHGQKWPGAPSVAAGASAQAAGASAQATGAVPRDQEEDRTTVAVFGPDGRFLALYARASGQPAGDPAGLARAVAVFPD